VNKRHHKYLNESLKQVSWVCYRCASMYLCLFEHRVYSDTSGNLINDIVTLVCEADIASLCRETRTFQKLIDFDVI
jgi:hypothetical protein